MPSSSDVVTIEKACTVCRNVFPVESFAWVHWKRGNRKGKYRRSHCRECFNKTRRARSAVRLELLKQDPALQCKQEGCENPRRAVNPRSETGYYCPSCVTLQWYVENKDRHLATSRRCRAIRRRVIAQFIAEYKLAQGCMDCGFNADSEALEFDHVKEKSFNVSMAPSYAVSQDRLLAEIAKCEVVCANCHRVRTRLRREAA